MSREIQAISQQQEQIKAGLLGARQLTPVKVQGGNADIQQTYVKLMDLGKRLECKLDELTTLKTQAWIMIEALDDARYRIILLDYYITGSTWEQVAVNNHWSIQHVYRLHGEALKQFQVLLDQEESK